MRLKRLAVVFLMACFWEGRAVVADPGEIRSNYTIALDDQLFSIVVPESPDNEFAVYRPSLSLSDGGLFNKSKSVIGLKLQWTYREGIFRNIAGVLEMKVKLRIAEGDVVSDAEIEKQLLEYFRNELSKVGYEVASIDFKKDMINGHSWMKYQVPKLNSIEYSTGLPNKRILTVQFGLADNTDAPSPNWMQDATNLMERLVMSMQIQAQ